MASFSLVALCICSHVVLQLAGVGSHDGGGPLHYAFCVTEAAFDRGGWPRAAHIL